MNCFPAESARFSAYLLTCEEGFIGFLNISVRHVKNAELQTLDDCGL